MNELFKTYNINKKSNINIFYSKRNSIDNKYSDKKKNKFKSIFSKKVSLFSNDHKQILDLNNFNNCNKKKLRKLATWESKFTNNIKLIKLNNNLNILKKVTNYNLTDEFIKNILSQLKKFKKELYDNKNIINKNLNHNLENIKQINKNKNELETKVNFYKNKEIIIKNKIEKFSKEKNFNPILNNVSIKLKSMVNRIKSKTTFSRVNKIEEIEKKFNHHDELFYTNLNNKKYKIKDKLDNYLNEIKNVQILINKNEIQKKLIEKDILFINNIEYKFKNLKLTFLKIILKIGFIDKEFGVINIILSIIKLNYKLLVLDFPNYINTEIYNIIMKIGNFKYEIYSLRKNLKIFSQIDYNLNNKKLIKEKIKKSKIPNYIKVSEELNQFYLNKKSNSTDIKFIGNSKFNKKRNTLTKLKDLNNFNTEIKIKNESIKKIKFINNDEIITDYENAKDLKNKKYENLKKIENLENKIKLVIKNFNKIILNYYKNKEINIDFKKVIYTILGKNKGNLIINNN